MMKVVYNQAEFDAAAVFVFHHNRSVFDSVAEARECLGDMINQSALRTNSYSITCGGFHVCFERDGMDPNEVGVRIYVCPALDRAYEKAEWVCQPPLPIRPAHKPPSPRVSAWKRLTG